MLRLLLAMLLATVATAQQYFAASLDGAQQVPPLGVAGRGWAVVRLDPATGDVRIFVYHRGLSGPPTAAHLHAAPVGVNGGVVVGLTPASANTFTGVGTLSPANVALLQGAGTYINVHTAANPGGEIRGQVVTSAATRFTGRLQGSQEVPPNPSGATGTVIAFLHEPENRLVYAVETTGLVNVTAAHVHQAPAGANGGVVFPLNGAAGSYCGVSASLTTAQVAALLADGMYVNVHTAAFPGGEIRAQLRKELGDHFGAALDGAQQVPPNPSGGVGSANLVLFPDGVFKFQGSFGGLIGAPTAAHVHIAPAGANGGVVFPLTITGNKLQGSFSPSAADLAAVRAGNWYVNVHSTAFPGGEIRGQLGPARLPTTYGQGCPGSNGNTPQVGGNGFLSLGAGMDVQLYGGLASGIAAFAFGFSRDSASGVVPLPVELGALGINAPGCFLLLDPALLNLTLTDSRGCASTTLIAPFAPPLRGLDYYAQYIVLDPAANPGGFVASSALTMTMQ